MVCVGMYIHTDSRRFSDQRCRGGRQRYAGGEIVRLLAGHPDLTIGTLAAETKAGEQLGGSIRT